MQTRLSLSFGKIFFEFRSDVNINDQSDLLCGRCEQLYQRLTDEDKSRISALVFTIQNKAVTLSQVNGSTAAYPNNWALSLLAAVGVSLDVDDKLNTCHLLISNEGQLKLRVGMLVPREDVDFWAASKFTYRIYQQTVNEIQMSKMEEIARDLYQKQAKIDKRASRFKCLVYLQFYVEDDQWYLHWGEYSTALIKNCETQSLLNLWTKFFNFKYDHVGTGPYGANNIVFTQHGINRTEIVKTTVFDAVVDYILADYQSPPETKMQLRCSLKFGNNTFNFVADKDIQARYPELHERCEKLYNQLTAEHRERLVVWEFAIKDDQITLTQFNNCKGVLDPTNWARSAIKAVGIDAVDSSLIFKNNSQLDIHFEVYQPKGVGSKDYDFWTAGEFSYDEYLRAVAAIEKDKIADIANQLFINQLRISKRTRDRPGFNPHITKSTSDPHPRWKLQWNLKITTLHLNNALTSLAYLWSQVFDFTYEHVSTFPHDSIIFNQHGQSYKRDFTDSYIHSVANFILEDIQPPVVAVPEPSPEAPAKVEIPVTTITTEQKVDNILKMAKFYNAMAKQKKILLNSFDDEIRDEISRLIDNLILELYQCTSKMI